jgi:hypothetical protein
MLDGAIVVPLLQMIYSLLYEVSAILWGFQRALLLTGYVIMVLTDWLRSAFTPLLGALGAQTGIFLGPVFTIAILILAATYLLGVFLRIRVVEFKSAVVWLLMALLLFQGGPQLYQGTEEMRRGIASAFYQEGLTIMGSGGGALEALNTVGSGAEAAIPAPTNEFAPFLPSDQYVDGLDVAMSYLGADGYDVVAPPNAPHPIDRLPWTWLDQGGYFDPATSAVAFPEMTREAREAAIGRGVQASARLLMGGFISLFGVLEQLIHLALALAMGLAFASAFIAILFAFFKHTEVLVWSVLNLVIELFVQSVLMSLFLSLVISFVLVGAVTGNAVVTLGTVLVGLILVVILLLAALRAIWNGINRLFGAMGQVTGGTISAPGPVAAGAAGLATGGALGLVGGGLALASGNSLMQSAGIALGNNSGLTRAAYMTSMLPGLRETAFGQGAAEFAEGALARTALGPVLSGVVLPPRRRIGLEDERVDIQDYYRSSDSVERQTRMTSAFGAAAPRLAHVMDAHTEDEFLEIVDAVHAVRRANPSLPGSSAAFQGTVEARLPGDIAGRFTGEDLRFVVSTLGALPGETARLHAREGREEGHSLTNPPNQIIDTPLLARGIASALAGYQQAGAALPFSFQQAASTVAQSIGIPHENARPFGSHTAAVGHFVMQASQLALSPQQASQVIHEVRQQGHITTELRANLVDDPSGGRSTEEMNRAVRSLEAAARALPHALVTGQVMPAPVILPFDPHNTFNPGGATAAEVEGFDGSSS